MWDFFHRWVFTDFWVPVWPNIAAIVPTAILSVVWLDARNEIRHIEMKRHVEELHDKPAD